jgi:uncharacterized protein
LRARWLFGSGFFGFCFAILRDFHKTTRCVEHMIAKLLRQIAHCARQPEIASTQTGLDSSHPLLRFPGRIRSRIGKVAEKGASVMEREDIVAAIVKAAGGNLIGRVRLQKTVYLLDQLGLNSGFGYEYHHYGPYSRDLDNATADAKAFGLLKEEYDHRQSDGAMYSIFKLSGSAHPDDAAYGTLGRERASDLVGLFARTSVTVLELAATIDWLWRTEECADWQSELKKRKALKARHGRLERAVELLREIGLAPPATVPA